MSRTTQDILGYIRNHRSFSHPVFENWAAVQPDVEAVGALFHQIQKFCASTRPGWSFADALVQHGMPEQGKLIQEIVDSENGHGPELATMAGYLLNQRAGRKICPDLNDQDAVETQLRDYSDKLLANLPGYDHREGLAAQTRQAISVFEGRKRTDRESTIRNLGAALALEMVSNGHLIPGEKRCLVDSGIYGASMDDKEMHYLVEHYGEIGAEQQHEKNAIAAVAAILNDETEPLVMEGIRDFLDSLERFWDFLDSALLQSGYAKTRVDAVAA
jgi:hypothetical protein